MTSLPGKEDGSGGSRSERAQGQSTGARGRGHRAEAGWLEPTVEGDGGIALVLRCFQTQPFSREL